MCKQLAHREIAPSSEEGEEEHDYYGRITITFEKVDSETGEVRDGYACRYALPENNILRGLDLFHHLAETMDLVENAALDGWDFWNEDWSPNKVCLGPFDDDQCGNDCACQREGAMCNCFCEGVDCEIE